MSKSQILLKNSNDAREKENFLEALKFTDEALVAFSKDGNSLGFSEILASRFLTLRHLFEQTGDENFMILAKQDVLASVEIARKSGNAKALAVPLFNLGKAYDDLEEYQKAVETYREALENMQNNAPEDHGSEAEIAEMTIHLSFAEFKSGDVQALERLEQAINTLSKSDEDKYKKDVWLSGGYMNLAEAFKDNNKQKAKEALGRAREIIYANPDLTLRKKQLAKLEASFSL